MMIPAILQSLFRELLANPASRTSPSPLPLTSLSDDEDVLRDVVNISWVDFTLNF